MRYAFTHHFVVKYRLLSLEIQRKFDKRLAYLLDDISHPSLKAKKYDETRGIWQARIDRKFRFYFLIEKDIYILLDIQRHK